MGGGFDYVVHNRLSLRVIQAEYVYTNYDLYCSAIVNFTCIRTNATSQWNSVRLSAGLVYGLGNYYTPTPTAACTAASSCFDTDENRSMFPDLHGFF